MPSRTVDRHKRMTLIHSWAGVILAGILFAVFWTGSLAIFDKEIDRWMQPSLRLQTSSPVSLDDIVAKVRQRAGDVTSLSFTMPTPRKPALGVAYRSGEEQVAELIDPASGEALPLIDTHGGTEFFFPFHHNFRITWAPFALGTWITSLAALGMLMLLLSGIIIHKKLIADFFTFRPARKPRRLLLDIHNLSSMVALPFHILLPLTGLIINFGYFLPLASGATDTLNPVTGPRIEAAGEPARMQSIDDMVRAAEAEWSAADGGQARAQAVTVRDWGDTNARLTVAQRFPSRSVSMDRHSITFAGANGEIVDRVSAGPVKVARKWLEGIHWMQWDHPALRWLMFLAGLLGCAMIATGLLFWLESRRKVHGLQAVSWRNMHAMTVGATTGLIIASGAFVVSNRLLPAGATLFGEGRATLEVWVFFLVWIGAFAHAAGRGAAAWIDQAWAIAMLALLAVALNWVTTGDHLAATMARELWPVAGMDLVLLAGAGVAVAAAVGLRRRSATRAGSPRRPVTAAGMPTK